MSEWKKVRLGSLGKTFNGLTGKAGTDFGTGAPYIPYMNIFSNARIKPDHLEYVRIEAGERQSRVMRGDLFFTTSSETMEEVGMTAVLLDDIGEAYLNSFCFGFRLYDFDTLLPEFAVHLFRGQEVRKAISILGQGSTRYNLPKTPLLARLHLNLPVKATQRTIARILGTADGLIERTEALIGKQQQIKQGLLHDLFTRGVDAHGALRPPESEAPELYHQTELGWVPRGWGVEKLGQKLKNIGGHIQTGPFGSQLHAHEYTHTGIPVIMPQDINDARVGEAAIARINEERAKTLSRHRVQLNDVVLARRGELSRAACVTATEVDWVCGTGCLLIRSPKVQLNGQWLALVYGHSVTQRHVEARAIGSTMLNVSATLLSGLFMAFPTPEEQGEIARRVDGIQALIDLNHSELAKLRLLKTGLMQDLLTGRVGVEGVMEQVNNKQPVL